LFVCDTRTLKSKYLRLPGKESSTQSLAVIGGRILAYRLGQWYLYDKEKGFRSTKLIAPAFIPAFSRNITLHKDSKNDTIFLTANPSGTIYKLGVENEKVKLLGVEKVAGFINAIQVNNDTLKVHRKESSFEWINGKPKTLVASTNISDIVVDNQGNTWYSSLTNGLLVGQNHEQIQKIFIPEIKNNDHVTVTTGFGNNVMLGSKGGYLCEINPRTLKVVWEYLLPEDLGTINLVHPINKNLLLVSTSVGTYLLQHDEKILKPFFAFIIKNYVVDSQRLIVSSATGLYSFPFLAPYGFKTTGKILSLNEWNDWWHQYKEGFNKDDKYSFFWYLQRSRSLALTLEKKLFVSFMDGVYTFDNDGPKPLFYQGARIYANSMVAVKDKLYIGTLNNGLLVKDGAITKKITTSEGLFSNVIVKLKQENGFLWIIQDKGVQILDLQNDRIANNIELPQEMGGNIYDVTTWEGTALLTTSEGLYKIQLRPSKRYSSLNSILRVVVVNQKDSLLTTSASLKHYQNDLQFNLSVPWYSQSNSLYFKYRLRGAANSDQWFTTQPGERLVRFVSLMPGSYTFESYAVVAGFQEKNPVLFNFSIAKPWWQSPIFFAFILFVTGIGFYAIYRMRFQQVLQLEQVRRTISSDLHDEIGSTISSINIYSELAKSEKQNEVYLKLIQENTRDVIGKLDDLVWSINPKNDSMNQLLARMQSFAEPVLTGAGVHPHFSIEEDVMKQELSLEKKRNLYLSFKELVNNVVKHSGGKNCHISMAFQNNKIILTVIDDGVGINVAAITKERSGMYNLKVRAESMGSTFLVEGTDRIGTKATLAVPIR